MASSNVAEECFVPYEKMAQSTDQWHSPKLDSIKKWVAMEKIHGANFSFSVICTQTPDCRVKATRNRDRDTKSQANILVAKRAGYLKEGEHYFGALTQMEFIELEKEKARRVYAILKQRMDSDTEQIGSVTIFGELFGGYYPHPSVAPCPGVSYVQKEVVYCPDLKFCAFDIAVSTHESRRYLDYDICMEVFQESGFMYAEPLIIGILQAMISYPLGFESKLPAKFGLPALDKPNVAEGIVIKPLKNVVFDTKKGLKRVIFKRKVEGFAEVKPRGHDRGHNKQTDAGIPNRTHDLELLKYETFALITTQRVVNVISKLGRPPLPSLQSDKFKELAGKQKKQGDSMLFENQVEWKDIVRGLVKDVIEELESEHSELWAVCQGDREKMGEIMREMREQCTECVEEYKETLVE